MTRPDYTSETPFNDPEMVSIEGDIPRDMYLQVSLMVRRNGGYIAAVTGIPEPSEVAHSLDLEPTESDKAVTSHEANDDEMREVLDISKLPDLAAEMFADQAEAERIAKSAKNILKQARDEVWTRVFSFDRHLAFRSQWLSPKDNDALGSAKRDLREIIKSTKNAIDLICPPNEMTYQEVPLEDRSLAYNETDLIDVIPGDITRAQLQQYIDSRMPVDRVSGKHVVGLHGTLGNVFKLLCKFAQPSESTAENDAQDSTALDTNEKDIFITKEQFRQHVYEAKMSEEIYRKIRIKISDALHEQIRTGRPTEHGEVIVGGEVWIGELFNGSGDVFMFEKISPATFESIALTYASNTQRTKIPMFLRYLAELYGQKSNEPL